MDEEASTSKNSKMRRQNQPWRTQDEKAESTPKNPKDEGASTQSSLDKIPKEEDNVFTPQNLEVFTRNYRVKLGCGGFGAVYKGELPNGIPFAVKILNNELGKRAENQLRAEFSTLAETNHVNVVRLLGYCSDPDVKALVYEYMHNGSLDEYLNGQKAKIKWGKLYEIAVGTAEGIRYLHEEGEKKIIHYDIKPANILLSENLTPKVADFGLAEMFDMENTISTIQAKGTSGFVAPELCAALTRKSDVYSFGKVLFEMLWSTWNSKFMQLTSKEGFPEWVREKVGHRELKSVISYCGGREDRMKTETMCKVALRCIQDNPKKRPSMSEVVKMLLVWNEKMYASVHPFKDKLMRFLKLDLIFTREYYSEDLCSDMVLQNSKNSKNEEASTKSSLDEISNEQPTSFTPQNLQVFTCNYRWKLGCGGFGAVYKGEFPNGIPLAVKILYKDLGKRAEQQFIAQVNKLSRANHANLVRLHGYCSDPEVQALVYEYMDNGSLDGYLYEEKAKIEWGKLYEIAVGTAEGIRYLHEECEKIIIHYDIKPANILLSKDFSPKVADFGLAKIFDREDTISTITGGKGTPGFVAPEKWKAFRLTRKSDVYSFGKVLFEMLWSTWNSEFMQAESKARFPEWVREMDERNELESVISHCGDGEDSMKTEAMCRVALQCVQHNPKKRPSMSKVVEMLLLWKKEDGCTCIPIEQHSPNRCSFRDCEVIKVRL